MFKLKRCLDLFQRMLIIFVQCFQLKNKMYQRKIVLKALKYLISYFNNALSKRNMIWHFATCKLGNCVFLRDVSIAENCTYRFAYGDGPLQIHEEMLTKMLHNSK